MDLIFAADPDAAKIGFLYNIGQDSSATPIAHAKEYLDAKGIAYVERTGTNAAEVMQAAQALVADGVDAVFTPTDNTIMEYYLSIYEIFVDAGIPHYTGADSFALNGAFLGYGVDYANLGRETADMIFDILYNSASPASTPVKTFDNGTATINTETCAALGMDYAELESLFSYGRTVLASVYQGAAHHHGGTLRRPERLRPDDKNRGTPPVPVLVRLCQYESTSKEDSP